MNRIEARLQNLKQKNEKAFITYITAGLPDMAGMRELVKSCEAAGLDILELGIPFSDPIADGPVIQAASYKAIRQKVSAAAVLAEVQTLRSEGVNLPIVFMMYYNTILHYGVKNFVDSCIRAGVDGFIIPDLPYEEQGEIKEAIAAAESETEDACRVPILIQLVSPVSKERIPMLLNGARGFVYCVSSMGVTGQDAKFHREIDAYLSEVKEISKIPVMMGFGVRTAKDVASVKHKIDGVIVGSHFIRLLEESGYSTDTAMKYITEFKSELNRESEEL